MIPLSVPEIEGGSPERDGGGEGEEEEEGLVWADSSSWDCGACRDNMLAFLKLFHCPHISYDTNDFIPAFDVI